MSGYVPVDGERLRLYFTCTDLIPRIRLDVDCLLWRPKALTKRARASRTPDQSVEDGDRRQPVIVELRLARTRSEGLDVDPLTAQQVGGGLDSVGCPRKAGPPQPRSRRPHSILDP